MPHFCNDCHSKVQPNQPACKCGGKQAYAADNPAKEKRYVVVDDRKGFIGDLYAKSPEDAIEAAMHAERMRGKFTPGKRYVIFRVVGVHHYREGEGFKNPRPRHFDEAHEGSAGRTRHAARTKQYHPVAGHYRRYPKE